MSLISQTDVPAHSAGSRASTGFEAARDVSRLFQTPGLMWFARHELRLAWRDWMSMMTAGRRRRERVLLAVVLLAIAGLHLLAYAVLWPLIGTGIDPAAVKAAYVAVTAAGLLAFFMMFSQALESVTRAFYTRSDLELILTSPVSPRPVFAVRVTALTFTTAAMSTGLIAPFINVAAVVDQPGWLAAYIVLLAMAMVATAISVWLMLVMFRMFGASRTRLIAQVAAAVIGASFLIGMQVVAITSFNSFSRIAVLTDHEVIRSMPGIDSVVWLPVRAAMGEPVALVGVVLAALAVLAVTIWWTSARFGDLVLAASSIKENMQTGRGQRRRFRQLAPTQALRMKEWQLLRRDPWLVSQSLMQVLYLIPPALMLWKSYGDAAGVAVILVPVLVMALGQLAGGLAWLTISGEDAPELMGTAPISPTQVLRAKIEAVLLVIGGVGLPFFFVMSLFAPWQTLVGMAGVLAASASAIAIQLWFRGEAKRAHFRFRQTASRVATLSEAFSSLMWAGAAALFAAGSLAGVACVAIALVVLLVAWLMR